jgi:hypothetical protein
LVLFSLKKRRKRTVHSLESGRNREAAGAFLNNRRVTFLEGGRDIAELLAWHRAIDAVGADRATIEASFKR